MDNLFSNISKNISSKTKLELYTSLNQHLIGSSDVILWNKDFQVIDQDTYRKFSEAIYRKICTFYKLNAILPFQNFCIALLCSAEYSLNHVTMPLVREKSYLSAWRSMTVIADTGDDDVRNWLKARLNNRSSIGYSTALGINVQNTSNIVRKFSNSRKPTKFMLDEDKLSKACSSKKIKDIFQDTPVVVSSIIRQSTSTPEGQLDNLRLVHRALMSNAF